MGNEDPTTSELMLTLDADIKRCHKMLIDTYDQPESCDDDYEYHARNLIRSILAYIEAVTFSVKVSCVEACLNNGIPISDHERYLAAEVGAFINDKGEVLERSSKIRLPSNVRFAFQLIEKSTGKPSKFNSEDDWWSCLKSTIRVRDRLTHPRMPGDIDIRPDEVINALKAKQGFENVIMPEE